MGVAYKPASKMTLSVIQHRKPFLESISTHTASLWYSVYHRLEQDSMLGISTIIFQHLDPNTWTVEPSTVRDFASGHSDIPSYSGQYMAIVASLHKLKSPFQFMDIELDSIQLPTSSPLTISLDTWLLGFFL